MKVRMERRFDNVHTEVEVRDVSVTRNGVTPHNALNIVRRRWQHWLDAPNVIGSTLTRLDVPGHHYFDYMNQAWVRDGRYQTCGHSEADCGCYGKAHAGEPVTDWTEVY